jgi:hypothetical protein
MRHDATPLKAFISGQIVVVRRIHVRLNRAGHAGACTRANAMGAVVECAVECFCDGWCARGGRSPGLLAERPAASVWLRGKLPAKAISLVIIDTPHSRRYDRKSMFKKCGRQKN